jgi:GDP-L-fucose synthase
MQSVSGSNRISPADRILVAGHRGMAGSAICRALQRAGYGEILSASRSELDLLDPQAVQRWFAEHRPTVVVLAAAKVGGIQANASYPADFLPENLKIQTHVIETAWRSGVRRLLFLGSSCIYPKFAQKPIREEALLTGALESHQRVVCECQDHRHQPGSGPAPAARFQILTKLYGPGDNHHPVNSQVLPTLIRRVHEAAEGGDVRVTCWGTGSPQGGFLHADDLGEACMFALEHWDPASPEVSRDAAGEPLAFLNVGTGVDLTIRELAEAVAEATGFRGEIHWDASKPDGTTKKQLDVSRLAALGWRARIPLAEGLRSTVALFREQLQQQLVRL